MLSSFLRQYGLLVLLLLSPSLHLFAAASPAPLPLPALNVVHDQDGCNGPEHIVIQDSGGPPSSLLLPPPRPPPSTSPSDIKPCLGSYKVVVQSPQNTTKIDCIKDNRLEVNYIVDELVDETLALDILALFDDKSFELATTAPTQPGEHSTFFTLPKYVVPSKKVVVRFLEKVKIGSEVTVFYNDIDIAYNACPFSPPKKNCPLKTTVTSTVTTTATVIASITKPTLLPATTTAATTPCDESCF